MITDLKTKDLLDLINRLYEREKNKLTIYGVSLWGIILAAIGLISYIYSIRKSISDYSNLKYVFTLLTNYLFFMFDVFNASKRRGKVKKLKQFSPKGLLIKFGEVLWIEIVYLLIILYTNWLCYNINHSVFRYINLYFVLYMSWRVWEATKFLLDRRRLKHSPNKSNKVKTGKTYLVSSVIHVILNLLVTIVFIKNTPFVIDDKSALVGLYLFLIEMMIVFLGQSFWMKRIKLGWLEYLERDIIIHDLDDKKIIEILRKEYLPFIDLDGP